MSETRFIFSVYGMCILGEKNNIVVPLPKLVIRTVQFRPRSPRKPQDTENTTDRASADECKTFCFLPTPMQSFCFPLPIPSSRTTPS